MGIGDYSYARLISGAICCGRRPKVSSGKIARSPYTFWSREAKVRSRNRVLTGTGHAMVLDLFSLVSGVNAGRYWFRISNIPEARFTVQELRVTNHIAPING